MSLAVSDNGKILIVDDEPNALKVLSAILSEDGYSVLESQGSERAVEIIERQAVDVVITDLRMPGRDGMQLFEYIIERHPEIPVIFLTAYGTVESAVSAITRGAFYYFIKPPDYLKLKDVIARAIGQRRMKRELELLSKRCTNDRYRLIGGTRQMLDIVETIRSIRDSASSVLICGETGTGKELISRALHYESIRRHEPFVAVNCAAIPAELLESELFGYEKGAFTGAHARRIGRFEEASAGTVFLDEVSELEPALQAKILRVLQEREIERLGSSRKIKVKFRLVTSVSCDLLSEVTSGNFREDLYYRINVVEIKVPPLRERRDDILLFAREFLNEFCLRENKTLGVSDEVMKIFQSYHWPGNVRQLRNIIERAVVLAREEVITTEDLPEEFMPFKRRVVGQGQVKTLREMELLAVRNALSQCKGNKSRAARVLGISRKALYRKLRGPHN